MTRKRLPIISVVVPLYNKRQSVASTLKSVLSQTWIDFEIIVVDDGSTDGSAAVVQSISDTRIKLLRQTNAGVSAARNRGVGVAKGCYIAFLDADDLWDEGYLGYIASLIEEFPDADIWCTSYRKLHPSGQFVDVLQASNTGGNHPRILSNYFATAAHVEQPFYTSSACIRKDALERLGGFKVGLKHGEDLDVWARVAVTGKIAYLPLPCVTYRLGAENRAMNKFPELSEWTFTVEDAKLLAKAQFDKELENSIRAYVERVNIFTVEANLLNPDAYSVRRFLSRLQSRQFRLKKTLLKLFLLLPFWLRRLVIQSRAMLRRS